MMNLFKGLLVIVLVLCILPQPSSAQDAEGDDSEEARALQELIAKFEGAPTSSESKLSPAGKRPALPFFTPSSTEVAAEPSEVTERSIIPILGTTEALGRDESAEKLAAKTSSILSSPQLSNANLPVPNPVIELVEDPAAGFVTPKGSAIKPVELKITPDTVVINTDAIETSKITNADLPPAPVKKISEGVDTKVEKKVLNTAQRAPVPKRIAPPVSVKKKTITAQPKVAPASARAKPKIEQKEPEAVASPSASPTALARKVTPRKFFGGSGKRGGIFKRSKPVVGSSLDDSFAPFGEARPVGPSRF